MEDCSVNVPSVTGFPSSNCSQVQAHSMRDEAKDAPRFQSPRFENRKIVLQLFGLIEIV